jgi:hypothetical protein
MFRHDAEIMGDVGFGLDQYPSSYLPIENEPMGNSYSPSNFDSSVNETKIYPYNPLTYKTNSRSYLDSWDSINEYFKGKKPEKSEKPGQKSVPISNKEHCCGGVRVSEDNQFYVVLFMAFIFIIIIIFAYSQNRRVDDLQKMIEILMKSGLSKAPV